MELPHYREEYVEEVLARGWRCRKCRTSNNDEPTFRITCEQCGAKRPLNDHVARGTRGK